MPIDGADRSLLRARIDVVSSKAAAVFDDVVADVERRLPSDALARWVELGCVIASGSSPAAIKYFRESPALFEHIEPAAIASALGAALRLGREAPHAALEVMRHAPDLTPRLDRAALEQWAAIGADVARRDYGMAIEYVKESAGLA